MLLKGLGRNPVHHDRVFVFKDLVVHAYRIPDTTDFNDLDTLTSGDWAADLRSHLGRIGSYALKKYLKLSNSFEANILFLKPSEDPLAELLLGSTG